MKKISENLYNKLQLQSKEAEIQGLTTIQQALDYQLYTNSKKTAGEKFNYPENEFVQDVKNDLWSAIIRTANYYEATNFDAREIQINIDKIANDLITCFRNVANVKENIGAYENDLPGEELTVEIEE